MVWREFHVIELDEDLILSQVEDKIWYLMILIGILYIFYRNHEVNLGYT